MTIIDPSRLTAILRTLSVNESSRTADHLQNQKNIKSSPSLIIQRDNLRDKDELKNKIRERLKHLKNHSTDFTKEAPEAVIKEVLLWEFGDELLNHPEYHHLSKKIVEQISSADKLKKYLANLINSYAKD